MLETLVVGLGRAGVGLHLPVLAQARRRADGQGPFADTPIATYDQDPAAPRLPGTMPLRSLEQAAERLDPARTVVHLCTPPTARAALVGRLAAAGFRRFLVEKPLALDTGGLDEISDLRRQWGLRLSVVSQWLECELTHRLTECVRTAALGRLETLSVVQRKPRFTRTLYSDGHPTAFDVELPHSVALVLRLAGAAELRAARSADMLIGDIVVEHMGRAEMALDHVGGPRSSIVSDLTSPVRERRITLGFQHGVVTGHYPGSRDDHHAQLRIATGGRETLRVFPDNALLAFMAATYRRFAAGDGFAADFGTAAEVVRLIDAAKRLAARPPAGPRTPSVAGAEHHAG